MTNIQHRDLAAGRWCELALVEQLGNVGSEVSRAIRWQSRNPDLSRAALHRAPELFDLTLADPANDDHAAACERSPGRVKS